MRDISTEWKELRPQIGNLICHIDGMNAQIDAKLKALQEKEEEEMDWQSKIDKVYNKGLEDARNAICHLYDYADFEGIKDLNKIFGISSVAFIVKQRPMSEIIEKINQLKTEKEKQAKEQDFRVGDEIICTNEVSMDYNKTFIYLGRDKYWMKMFDLDKMRAESTNNFTHYRKTGKHYDAIPILVGMSKP